MNQTEYQWNPGAFHITSFIPGNPPPNILSNWWDQQITQIYDVVLWFYLNKILTSDCFSLFSGNQWHRCYPRRRPVPHRYDFMLIYFEKFGCASHNCDLFSFIITVFLAVACFSPRITSMDSTLLQKSNVWKYGQASDRPVYSNHTFQ